MVDRLDLQKGTHIRYQLGGSMYEGVVASAGRKWLTLDSGVRVLIEHVTEVTATPYGILCDMLLRKERT